MVGQRSCATPEVRFFQDAARTVPWGKHYAILGEEALLEETKLAREHPADLAGTLVAHLKTPRKHLHCSSSTGSVLPGLPTTTRTTLPGQSLPLIRPH